MNTTSKNLLSLFALVLFLAPNARGAAGELDTTFNPGTGATGGLVFVTAVQSDGKIIIAGSFTSYNGVPQNRIARLNANGTLDGSFAIQSGPNDQISTLAIQPDGKIIIAGFFTSFAGDTTRRIARLNPNGSVDGTFNPHVAFDQTNGADDAITELKLQADAKIVIGGLFRSYRTVTRNFVARLLSNGTLDTSFNPGTGPDINVSALGLDGSGRVLIGGAFSTVSGQNRRGIARLNTNGTMDLSFTGTGINGGVVYDILVIPDGRILAAGAFNFYNTTAVKNLVRINPDGTADTSFTSSLTSSSAVFCVALQPTGKILAGGPLATTSSPGVTVQNKLARLNDNGSVDSTFKSGTGPNNDVSSITLTSDGRIIIGGTFVTYNGVARSHIARLFGVNPSALRNIATRAGVQTGDRVAIAGFIITGSGTKEVLFRGIGPSLTAAGVPNALQDPVIELYNSSGALINSNDNWRDTQQNAIAETGIPPSDNREAALLINLGAGSYTVMLRGKNATTGNGVVELYDLTGATGANLANISTRAVVGAGDNVLIGGFIVEGDNSRVVARGLGPSLGAAGVPGALADPKLAVYNSNGVPVGYDDDWKQYQQSELIALGVQPSSDLEAAMILMLQAGNYTAVVEGLDNSTGVGLVEIYNLQ
jgi:uncharacterized delta-60 repeat protein